MSNYFSIDKITPIQSLKPGSKIHIIGICGTAMAPLAVALAKLGFEVSGSDREYYEPMASVLRKQQIKLIEGFKKENVTKELALIVIGNIATKDYPEVLAAEELKIPYTIFTQSLYDILIGSRHSIVITGTHGKTTTTSLAATTLVKLNADPSYFIGGQVHELAESFHIGSGKISVVEGDEYDSAFFAKVPKFSFYKPNTLIITSIEYDHADIYPDLIAIEREFTKLVNSLSAKDTCICCIDNEVIRRLLPGWKKTIEAPRFITYGHSPKADLVVSSKEIVGAGFQQVEVATKDRQLLSQSQLNYQIPLSGAYNALNSAAVLVALRLQEFNEQQLLAAFASFKGVRRRQEVVIEKSGVTLIEDFAHHPTAVKETLSGIKVRFPNRRLIAIFEPRSNTSRRPVFRDPYRSAFDVADRIIIGEVKRREIDKDEKLLQAKDLVEDLKKSGKIADFKANAEEIVQLLGYELNAGDLIVVMSNGGFDGVVEKLKSLIEAIDKSK